MEKVANLGGQSFETMRMSEAMYIDKTRFIKDWWESEDRITVLTKPPRYGKSLNIDTVRCFFSNIYEGRKELFEGLYVWHYDKYRKLQGKYPVIYLDFERILSDSLLDTVNELKMQITDMYDADYQVVISDKLTDSEKSYANSVTYKMSDEILYQSVSELCKYMYKYYDKKVIVLVDGYDYPILEAEQNGYKKEILDIISGLFRNLFSENEYLEKALLIGLTNDAVSDILPDDSIVKIIASSSEEYSDCFGFSKEEILGAMSNIDMSNIDMSNI